MQIFISFQRIMGIFVSAGFFAHDVHFTAEFMGFDIFSLIFLFSLLWFHILVFLKESGFAQVRSEKHETNIKRLRISIVALTILSAVIYNFKIITVNNVTSNDVIRMMFTVIIMIFPEFIFHVAFAFQENKKNDGNVHD